MNSGQALNLAAGILKSNKFEDYHIEARAILGHVLDKTPAQLYTNTELALTSGQRRRLIGLIERRLLHEPVPYLLGYAEFYGRKFFVNKNVLIPRPETENLVEEAIKWISMKKYSMPAAEISVADVGTGSGVIAITIALRHPDIKIFASDVSPKALSVARRNSRAHAVSRRMRFYQGDLLRPIRPKLDLIIANLPYIAQTELLRLSPEINRFEPIEALDGGPKGVSAISALLSEARNYLKEGGCLLLEIGAGQSKRVAALAKRSFSNSSISMVRDYGGIERVIKIQT